MAARPRDERRGHAARLAAALLAYSSLIVPAAAAQRGEDFDLAAFLADHAASLGPAIAAPARHRVQVLYTRIDRDARGHPQLATYGFRADAEYFYPASTVKLPVAVLALERLRALAIDGLDRDTPMFTGAAHPSQQAVTTDPTAPGGVPTVAHYVRSIFAVSDNDAFNRLYEFLGQDAIANRLDALGYDGVRIVHRLSVALGEEDNLRSNPVTFALGDRVLHRVPARLASGRVGRGVAPIPLGVAEIVGGVRVEGAKDFAGKNALPLRALHGMVTALMLPEAVPAARRFALSADDLAFLRRAMATTPGETGVAQWADRDDYPPGYVKFLLYGGDARVIPSAVRVFNKVGEAYGFLTDSAYVVDFERGIEFLLSATVYANANGVFNDDTYEYDEVGLPFLEGLGQAVYAMETARPREHRPDLSPLAALFE